MRLTQDALLKNVQNMVDQRARVDRSLLAVFLCGSILEKEFLMGGATDIDLFFIHTETVAIDREIIPLTSNIHFDISHHFQRDFRQTRDLRIHPWFGPTINRCNILFDPQHFLDFVQASVRGQFNRADFTMTRARKLFESARNIWLGLQTDPSLSAVNRLDGYLRALYLAANAVSSLTGAPLTERRFLRQFPERASAVQHPGLFAGLLGLLGVSNFELEGVPQCLLSWQTAYKVIQGKTTSANLHPGRQMYFQKAIESQFEGDQPRSCLWLLLRTWTMIALDLPKDSDLFAIWTQQMDQVGLLGNGLEERVYALDSFLDQVDETIEDWALKSGAVVS